MTGRELVLELTERFTERPVAADHTSAYWLKYASSLDESGFECPYARNRREGWLAAVERWTYLPVTRRLPQFSRVWNIGLPVFETARDADSNAPRGAQPIFNFFKAVSAASVLEEFWLRERARPATVAVIGDGYGMLGALLGALLPAARLYAIDLPSTLVAQARTYAACAPPGTDFSVDPGRAARFTLLDPAAIAGVVEPIECAVNVTGMQEMMPREIGRYFAWLRVRRNERSHFYCVNRLDKTLPDGTRVRFADYPWQPDDEVVIDERCGYVTHMLTSRPPFIRRFDGIHQHRLVRVAPAWSGEALRV